MSDLSTWFQLNLRLYMYFFFKDKTDLLPTILFDVHIAIIMNIFITILLDNIK